MSYPILFGDTPENFYQHLKEFIQTAIHEELSIKKKAEEPIFIKKPEVVKLLRISDPTVDSHVRKGYYQKYEVGERVFYKKQEIIDFLEKSASSGKKK